MAKMLRKPLQTPKITFTISIKLQPVASLMKMKKMKIPNPKNCSMYSRLRNFTTSLSKMKTRYSLLLHQVILTSY